MEPAFEAYVDKTAFVTGIASSNTMPAKTKRMIKTFLSAGLYKGSNRKSFLISLTHETLYC